LIAEEQRHPLTRRVRQACRSRDESVRSRPRGEARTARGSSLESAHRGKGRRAAVGQPMLAFGAGYAAANTGFSWGTNSASVEHSTTGLMNIPGDPLAPPIRRWARWPLSRFNKGVAAFRGLSKKSNRRAWSAYRCGSKRPALRRDRIRFRLSHVLMPRPLPMSAAALLAACNGVPRQPFGYECRYFGGNRG